MRIAGKVAVVTGAARGIGAAMARRFAAEGAAGILVSDIDAARVEALAAAIRRSEPAVAVLAMPCDVADAIKFVEIVEAAEKQFGAIDLFCSNAGIVTGLGLEATDADWSRAWAINLMAHVYAARAVLPSMLARGSGYLLNTCSAAGLLSLPGDAPYTATKHAAVAFAEWLSFTYGDSGIKVSALCPQGVRTPMLTDRPTHGAARFVAATGAVLEPEQVTDAVIDGLAAERFLILPQPEVSKFVRRKAADPDDWLAAMRRVTAAHFPSLAKGDDTVVTKTEYK